MTGAPVPPAPFATSEPRSPLGIERGRVSLRTLILIRWIAIAGQAATLLTVHFALGLAGPLEVALAIVGASALINIANSFQRPAAVRLGDRDATFYLAFDVIQLGALLSLTGGLRHPVPRLVPALDAVGGKVGGGDLRADCRLTEDAARLLRESGRCRTVLAGLALRPEADGGTPYTRLPITALVEAAGAPHQLPGIKIVYRAMPPTAE